MKRTFDCAPTMTDTQIFEFCQKGYLMLEAVVPDEINRKSTDFLAGVQPGEADDILNEDWFVDNVILNPQAAGIIRSLLGRNFQLPIFMSNHRAKCPAPPQHWHRDGGSIYGPKIDALQVFYYPHDTPVEMGPTDLVPGSHFFFALQSYMAHYTGIRGVLSTAAPAGSIFVTIYHMWHRKGASTATGIRDMLKYWYVRSVPPQRDWIVEQNFDIDNLYNMRSGHYPYGREAHRAFNDTAEIFLWLSGKHEDYRGTDSSLPIYLA